MIGHSATILAQCLFQQAFLLYSAPLSLLPFRYQYQQNHYHHCIKHTSSLNIYALSPLRRFVFKHVFFQVGSLQHRLQPSLHIDTSSTLPVLTAVIIFWSTTHWALPLPEIIMLAPFLSVWPGKPSQECLSSCNTTLEHPTHCECMPLNTVQQE